MSYAVVVLLSLLWLGFFLPGLLQARRSSPLNSATTFQQSLTRISTGRAVGSSGDASAAVVVRRRSRREIARQRDILAGLSAAVIATIVLGVAFGGPARWLVVPVVIAFVGYIAALRRRTVQSQAARRRPLPVPADRAVISETPARPEPDGVVPSVRRRAAAHDLDRIAG